MARIPVTARAWRSSTVTVTTLSTEAVLRLRSFETSFVCRRITHKLRDRHRWLALWRLSHAGGKARRFAGLRRQFHEAD